MVGCGRLLGGSVVVGVVRGRAADDEGVRVTPYIARLEGMGRKF